MMAGVGKVTLAELETNAPDAAVIKVLLSGVTFYHVFSCTVT
jgi:hypothetical protein